MLVKAIRPRVELSCLIHLLLLLLSTQGMTAFNLFDHKVNVQLPRITQEGELKRIVEEIDATLAPSLSHGYFATRSHGKLHYRKYLPDSSPPKGVVVFQHGIQADCGMSVKLDDGGYTNMGLLSRKFTAEGYALYTVDMLGHGLSEGERFYIPDGDWTINRDHLEAFAQMAGEDIGHDNRGDGNDARIPLFLMGESYGGCLAIHVAKRWQDDPERVPAGVAFKGLLLNAPAIVGDLPVRPVIRLLVFLASIQPRSTPFFMPNSVSPERIWKDAVVREFYTSPKSKEIGLQGTGQTFCLGTALGLLNALECVREDVIPGLTVPFCVHHGTRDEAIKPEGTGLLSDASSTEGKDKSVFMVEDALHDLLSDGTKEQTVERTVSWMKGRL